MLKDLLYAEINLEKVCSILLIKKSFTIFSLIFEKVFETLTGRKLVTEYLSSVCLSKGETHPILALSGNIPLLKVLLIAMANGLLKTFAVLLVLFESYLYLWISSYQYFLKIVLHHKRKPLDGGCFLLLDFLLCYFLL